MRQIFGVTLFLVLSYSAAHAQNPWNWHVSPSNPTEIDTVDIDMSFYSNYNLSFESDHTVNDTDIVVNVDVFTGMLPISGWFYHRETIGCLDPGFYSCAIYVDYYVWNMGGWWDYVGSDYDSGNFGVRPVGDANGDGVIDLGDVLYLINYLYKGGPAPDPLEAGDADCSGEIDLGDVLYLINYLYKGGPPPLHCDP